MTDTMHAHPAPSGPVIGDIEARADEHPATSDDLIASIPWEMKGSDEAVRVPDAATRAVESISDALKEDAAHIPTPTATPKESERVAARPVTHRTDASRSARLSVLLTAVVAVALAVALIAVVAVPRLSGLASAPPRGEVSIVSDEPARVSIDGKDYGPAPVAVSLEPGPHAVRVLSGQSAEAIAIVVSAGAHEVHHVHSMPSIPPAVATGTLRVTTPEPGARIALDGAFRGLSPMLFAGLSPGVHSLVVSKGTSSVRREITIDSDRTIELDLVPSATGTTGSMDAGGWVGIKSPFDVEIYEAGTLIGSSRTARLMLKPGPHTLELVNQTLMYRERRSVAVSAGRTTSLQIVAPKGTLSVNATPWADVWVDGSRVGETPLGDISLPIGPHDIVLRHPDFAERHVQSIVRVGEVTRVALDLRKPATQP